MKTTALLLISSLLLSACAVKSAEQQTEKPKTTMSNTLDKRSQTGTVTSYLCKDNKVVRVVSTKTKKSQKLKKVENINLTFNGITGKLKSTVTESGKAYTSIHWHWVVRVDGSATLTNAVGVILADLCVIQKSETETTK